MGAGIPTGDDHTRTVWRDRGAQIARLLAENAALTRECLDREATEADARSRLAGAEAEVVDSQTRLRDMEIERNMLRSTLREVLDKAAP